MLRGALALSLAVGAAGARVRKNAMIEGVPVINNREGIEDFIVTFADGTSEDNIAKFCGGECALFAHPKEGEYAWAAVRGRAILETLLKRRGEIEVASVEPDEEYSIPDGELQGEEEELGIQSTPWNIRRVGAPNRPAGGRGAHIYILDTGIRVTHNEFGGRAIRAIDMTFDQLWECRGDSRCAGDVGGHGTHCAGSAGGRTHGVAPHARVYSAKVLPDSGSGRGSWTTTAVAWVGQNGVRPAIISMSLGGSRGSGDERWLRDVVRAGVVVVSASGNNNGDACQISPAFSQHSITVGSTTSRDARSGFSNWGSCVDIMAPGSSIQSAAVSSDRAFRGSSGTSMACPHVAGGAALILGRNPGTSVSDVRARLTGRDYADRGAIRDLRGSADRFLNVGPW